MQQTIEVLMEDKPGALMRALGIFTAKGCNIDSLTLHPDSLRPGVASMVLVADVEERLHQRVVNELNRQIHVLSARVMTP